jgi:hypothetical protein
MAIRVACPTCGQGLRAPDVLAGSRVPCPGCRADVAVPLPGDPPKGEPAAAARGTARPRDRGAAVDLEHAPPATRLGVVALGLGLLSIAALCLPFIGYGSLVLRVCSRRGAACEACPTELRNGRPARRACSACRLLEQTLSGLGLLLGL